MIYVPSITEQTKGTILFIHGMCHAAWCWDQGFMQEFAQAGYDCYAIDLPLHDKPGKHKAVNKVSINDYVNAVKQAIRKIDSEVIIIGHSMGGFITQKYLETYTCKAAVLLASVPYNGILSVAIRYLTKHPDAFPSLIMRDIYGPFVKHAEELYAPATDRVKIEYYKSLMRSESFTAFLNMFFKPVKISNPRHVPLLIIGGNKDKVISVNEIKKTCTFHQEEPIIFSDLGHNLMLDKGYHLVSSRVIQWLTDL